jgi:hypothetical protein
MLHGISKEVSNASCLNVDFVKPTALYFTVTLIASDYLSGFKVTSIFLSSAPTCYCGELI